ncbi:MAG: methyltransferase domain-containing protein [Caulobacteraceae bacterium]|nr:methyltransferase domain-containing protein [Caulobacteraceae bacterium]
MPAAADFAERRFQSAAAHYLTGRAPYPPELIERVAQRLGLSQGDRLLDLGCGPGQLAMAFAPLVGQVLALDPEPQMLALAQRACSDLARSGWANVVAAPGGSADLGPHLGRFRCVVIGRAFHWMDRPETLHRLDGLLEPDGAVVLFGDERSDLPENAWVRAYEALLERYSSDDEDRRRRKSTAFAPHVSVLLASPFDRLERIGVIRRRALGLDDLIERALSLSSTSRARLGERTEAMIEELTATAKSWSADGLFTEVLTSNALIAQRS